MARLTTETKLVVILFNERIRVMIKGLRLTGSGARAATREGYYDEVRGLECAEKILADIILELGEEQ